MRKEKPTPFAHVADNDLAVGLFIHSTIWKENVVFIVEDDAQNGPDHVNAHQKHRIKIVYSNLKESEYLVL